MAEIVRVRRVCLGERLGPGGGTKGAGWTTSRDWGPSRSESMDDGGTGRDGPARSQGERAGVGRRPGVTARRGMGQVRELGGDARAQCGWRQPDAAAILRHARPAGRCSSSPGRSSGAARISLGTGARCPPVRPAGPGHRVRSSPVSLISLKRQGQWCCLAGPAREARSSRRPWASSRVVSPSAPHRSGVAA